MSREVEVTIAEMSHHFLYLPFHYAEDNDYFGFLPKGYKVKPLIRPAAQTDTAAFKMLERGTADWVICDPCTLLEWDRANSSVTPQVMAGLVTRAAFWAIDHEKPTVKFLTDLAQFSEIISYAEGTTSHGIAKRIARSCGNLNAPTIRQVEIKQELLALRGPGTHTRVALTPDILEVECLKEEVDESIKIKLALAETSEFANVLVTALLSTAHFVEQHRDFSIALLRALQHALSDVLLADDKVITCGAKAHGKSPDVVRRALAIANRAEVYPAILPVSEVQWTDAVSAHHESYGRPFDRPQRDQASDLFRTCIEPGTALATGVRFGRLKTARDASRPSGPPLPAIVGAGLLVVLVAIESAVSPVRAAFEFTFLWALLPQLMEPHSFTRVDAKHLVLCAGMLGVSLAYAFGRLSGAECFGSHVTFVLADALSDRLFAKSNP